MVDGECEEETTMVAEEEGCGGREREDGLAKENFPLARRVLASERGGGEGGSWHPLRHAVR